MMRHHHTPNGAPRALLPLALFVATGCFEVDEGQAPPIANAGEDRSFPDDASVTLTLDGSGSGDPDGEIVEYQWRYTGDPRGDDAHDADEDGGAPDPLTALGFEPRPEFCPDPEPRDWVLVPERWCELASDGGPEVTLELPTGVHRFTLWVVDDDGNVAADSVIIQVGDAPLPLTAGH